MAYNENRDGITSIEEIMIKIRDNIRHTQIAAEDTEPMVSESRDIPKVPFEDSIKRDLFFINTNWDIHNNKYFISSHHPHIGKFLVKGRELVHGEVCRYVDPMISDQIEFNASTVRILNQILQKTAQIDLNVFQTREDLSWMATEQEERLICKISQQEDELSCKISQLEFELSQMISKQKEDLIQKMIQREEEVHNSIQFCINEKFRKTFSYIEKDLNLQMELAHLFEERAKNGSTGKIKALQSFCTDTNYFLFEDHFRGSREVIKKRQMEFLPFFKNCSRVLDIGCGRGEFLEILKENDIGGIGVDPDADMISYCNSRQLDVIQSDALSYMETIADESLDGIFIDQVVEHLEPSYLVRLLTLCNQKLKSGKYIAIETVNPMSFFSFVNFYIDLTHKRPVHPETLKFLVTAAGFTVCEIRFSSPVSDDSKLKKIIEIADSDEITHKNIGIYNNNIEMLNTILFGAQDYSVIARK